VIDDPSNKTTVAIAVVSRVICLGLAWLVLLMPPGTVYGQSQEKPGMPVTPETVPGVDNGKNMNNVDKPIEEKVKDAADSASELVKEGWDKTKETSKDVWDATRQGSKKGWEATKEISKDAARATKEAVRDTGEAIKEGYENTKESIKGK